MPKTKHSKAKQSKKQAQGPEQQKQQQANEKEQPLRYFDRHSRGSAHH
jgi:hypothetical protein